MPINDYALKFRTLTAASGWNERSLLTTYRQGLEPRVWLQLSAYDDSYGFERFIQLSIRCVNRMQSCFKEQQLSPCTLLLRHPETSNTPEPSHKPMQVDNTRLSFYKWQRQLTQGLCLYCGAGEHVEISICPIRPPLLRVSVIKPAIVNIPPLTAIVMLTAFDVSISVHNPSRLRVSPGISSPGASAANSTFQPLQPKPSTKSSR